MRTFQLFLIFSVFAALLGCCPESVCPKDEINDTVYQNGVLIKKPYIWTIPDSDGPENSIYFDHSPLYNRSVFKASCSIKEQKYYFSLVNVDNGNRVWSTENFFLSNKNEKFLDQLWIIYYIYSYNNICVIGEAAEPYIYAINMDNGQLLWTETAKQRVTGRVRGIDGYFFTSYLTGHEILYGLANKGELIELSGIEEEFEYPENLKPCPWDVYPFKDSVGDIKLLVNYDREYEEDKTAHFIGLFNFTKCEWVYDSIPTPGHLSGEPIVYKGKIYQTNKHHAVCFDLNSGSRIWEKNIGLELSFNGPILVEDKLIVAAEYLTAFDLNSGEIIWRTKTTSNTSRFQYLNGIIYFTGGDLWAVEASSGKILWSLRPPVEDVFKEECAVVEGLNGEKGRVVVSTYHNTYCYEAER
jgi:outer membrane protein assembly factor BamB